MVDYSTGMSVWPYQFQIASYGPKLVTQSHISNNFDKQNFCIHLRIVDMGLSLEEIWAPFLAQKYWNALILCVNDIILYIIQIMCTGDRPTSSGSLHAINQCKNVTFNKTMNRKMGVSNLKGKLIYYFIVPHTSGLQKIIN